MKRDDCSNDQSDYEGQGNDGFRNLPDPEEGKCDEESLAVVEER